MTVEGELLRPAINAENAPFWEATRRGELWVQQCPQTGRLIFPPRVRSPWAPAAAAPPAWVRVSGRGTIWSYAVPHPPLLPYYAARAPYNVILVALEEDPNVRLVGNLVASAEGDIGEIDPATIVIGAAVEVVFHRVDEELTLPRWVLV
jgi:uncharacterized OB-fold protein